MWNTIRYAPEFLLCLSVPHMEVLNMVFSHMLIMGGGFILHPLVQCNDMSELSTAENKINHTHSIKMRQYLTWFTQPIWATSTKQRHRLSYYSTRDYNSRFLTSALPLPLIPHTYFSSMSLQFIDVEKKLNNKFNSILSQQNRI